MAVLIYDDRRRYRISTRSSRHCSAGARDRTSNSKRAFGIVYGIAAGNVFARAFLPLSLYELGLLPVYSSWVNIAVNVILALSALAVTIWIFRRVFATRFVRRSVSGTFWTLTVRLPPAALISAISFAWLIAAFILFGSEFSRILSVFYAVGTPFFYYSLKICFPEGLPSEGKAAVLAYAVATMGIFVLSISTIATSVLPYLFFCGIELAGFFFAFVHSRSVSDTGHLRKMEMDMARELSPIVFW